MQQLPMIKCNAKYIVIKVPKSLLFFSALCREFFYSHRHYFKAVRFIKTILKLYSLGMTGFERICFFHGQFMPKQAKRIWKLIIRVVFIALRLLRSCITKIIESNRLHYGTFIPSLRSIWQWMLYVQVIGVARPRKRDRVLKTTDTNFTNVYFLTNNAEGCAI